MEIELSTVAASAAHRLNENQNNFKVSLFCTLEGGANNVQYSVEYSMDEQKWYRHDDIDDATTEVISNIYFPVKFIRLNVTAIDTGSIKLVIVQGA